MVAEVLENGVGWRRIGRTERMRIALLQVSQDQNVGGEERLSHCTSYRDLPIGVQLEIVLDMEEPVWKASTVIH